MFRVIDLPPVGDPEESADLDRVGPPPDGVFRWVDLVETDHDALQLLGDRFGFHPLAIEDCATFELHSKLEEYGDHLFVVLHTFTPASDDPCEIDIHEIHAFVAENYLVTVHDQPVASADAVWRKATTDRQVLSRGPGWALYRTADAMVDAVFPMLSNIASLIEEVESSILEQPDEDDLARIFQLRSTLVTMRRVIRPVRDVVGMLSRRATTPLSERSATYFRDVYDHVLRCAEEIDEAQGLVGNAMDAYHSSVTNRTNEIITKLTVFSAVFLPLGFITGFWGQNFVELPVDHTIFFYITLGLTFALPIGLLTYFRKSGWF